jgi:hypothetical protein
MKTYIFKIKNTNSFDYLEYGNLPLVDGFYQSKIRAEDLEQAAEYFGLGYDDVVELEAAE